MTTTLTKEYQDYAENNLQNDQDFELDLEVIEELDIEEYARKTFKIPTSIWMRTEPLFNYSIYDIILNVGMIIGILLLRFVCVESVPVESHQHQIADNNTTISEKRICRIDNTQSWFIVLFILCAWNVFHLIIFIVHSVLYCLDNKPNWSDKRTSIFPISGFITSVLVFIIYFSSIRPLMNKIIIWGDRVVAVIFILGISSLISHLLSIILMRIIDKRTFQSEQLILAKENLFNRFTQDMFTKQAARIRTKRRFHKTRKEILEKSNSELKEIIKEIYINMCKDSKKLTFQVLVAHYKNSSHAKLAWNLFTLGNADLTSISLHRFSIVLRKLWKDRANLEKEKENSKNIKKILRKGLFVIIYLLAFLISLIVILNGIIDIAATLASAITLGVSFTFMFGNLIKEVVEGFVFVLIDNKIRIGDRVIIDGTTVIISNMELRHTIAYTPDGRRCIWSNSQLARMKIENRTRSTNMSLDIKLKIGFETSSLQLMKLKKQVEKFVDNHQVQFQPNVLFYIDEIQLDGIFVKFWVTLNGIGWATPLDYLVPQTEIMLCIKDAVTNIGIPIHAKGISFVNIESTKEINNLNYRDSEKINNNLSKLIKLKNKVPLINIPKHRNTKK